MKVYILKINSTMPSDKICISNDKFLKSEIFFLHFLKKAK